MHLTERLGKLAISTQDMDCDEPILVRWFPPMVRVCADDGQARCREWADGWRFVVEQFGRATSGVLWIAVREPWDIRLPIVCLA